MTNGHIAGQWVEVAFSESLGDQSHVRVNVDGLAVGGGYARAFLTTML